MFLEQRLRMCFNTLEWDEKTVIEKKLTWFDKQASENDRRESADYVKTQMRRLMEATPVTQAVNDELRKMLDDTYKKHMDRGETWKLLGSTHETWVDGYRKYVRDVVDLMKNQVAKWPDSAEKQDASDDVKKAWRDCWSKAKVVLEIQDVPTEPEHMPFMCVSFWQALARQLKRVSNALLEVSDRCDDNDNADARTTGVVVVQSARIQPQDHRSEQVAIRIRHCGHAEGVLRAS